MSKKSVSFLGRAGRYGANKIQSQTIRDTSRGAMRAGGEAAMDALRPARADLADMRAGLDGRYWDGGHQRFREMVDKQGLSEADLAALAETHGRNFRLYTGLSIAFLVGAFGMIFLGDGALSFLGTLVLLIFMLGALVRGLQADFAAYQIRVRAFCGLRQYLREGFFSR